MKTYKVILEFGIFVDADNEDDAVDEACTAVAIIMDGDGLMNYVSIIEIPVDQEMFDANDREGDARG